MRGIKIRVRDTGESVRSSNLHINELAEQEEKMRQNEHLKTAWLRNFQTGEASTHRFRKSSEFQAGQKIFKAYLLINTLQTVEQQSEKS